MKYALSSDKRSMTFWVQHTATYILAKELRGNNRTNIKTRLDVKWGSHLAWAWKILGLMDIWYIMIRIRNKVLQYLHVVWTWVKTLSNKECRCMSQDRSSISNGWSVLTHTTSVLAGKLVFFSQVQTQKHIVSSPNGPLCVLTMYFCVNMSIIAMQTSNMICDLDGINFCGTYTTHVLK